jgi:hypothetical protein
MSLANNDSSRSTEDFRVNTRLKNHLAQRKQEIRKRLDKTRYHDNAPVFAGKNIHYEIAGRTRAVACGGLGMIHQMVQHLRLANAIDRAIPLFKFFLPYTESDHVLNIAYNILAGGTCLDHLELRRNDAVYLDALGVQRIPDPTTAGDFCRRFQESHVRCLMEAINEVRLGVWKLQPPGFFDEAIIEADGTMVETYGECKQGIDINYKKQWGYHPLVVSLANTGEPLYIVNRSGNRPSHEGAAEYIDRSIALCRQAGFRQITLRGDTDFTQTAHLDRWDDDGVHFIMGIDAMRILYQQAADIPESAWKLLKRGRPNAIQTKPRARPDNVKQWIVAEREFDNIRLIEEHVAEFDYRPTACSKTYRVVVVRKLLEERQGQGQLFDTYRCFFYITNLRRPSAQTIVLGANERCNQENLIQQQKGGVYALTAPLNTLVSNWAYMVIASLAWTLKAWAALLVPISPRHRDQHTEEKRRLLRMEFPTFRNALIVIPAQIIRTSRKIVYRLLAWNPWQPVFFRLMNRLRKLEFQ